MQNQILTNNLTNYPCVILPAKVSKRKIEREKFFELVKSLESTFNLNFGTAKKKVSDLEAVLKSRKFQDDIYIYVRYPQGPNSANIKKRIDDITALLVQLVKENEIYVHTDFKDLEFFINNDIPYFVWERKDKFQNFTYIVFKLDTETKPLYQLTFE